MENYDGWAAESDTPVATTPRDAQRVSLFDVLRWTLAVLWVFVMAVAVLAGSRSSDLGTLEAELSSGNVTAIEVTPGLPANADGSVAQSVYWRSGILRRHAEVQMITPGSGISSSSAGTNPVRSGHDIASMLVREHPDLVVTHVSQTFAWGQIYGFRVPSWLAWPALVGAVLTLMVLVSGAEPWRATRWAWFWLIGTVIGAPLFLILSGPTWSMSAPRASHWRLTGGWAFIIAAVLGSFMLP